MSIYILPAWQLLMEKSGIVKDEDFRKQSSFNEKDTHIIIFYKKIII
jgi:hypothetical protein